MADQSVPTKNQAYIIATSLVSQADANIFQNLPTLAVGDARRNTYNGAVWAGWANTTNVAAQNGERGVIITLTAGEMNNDIVHVVLHDAAGAEWQDQAWILHPSDDTLPVLSAEVAAVAGDTWDEARVGHAGVGTFGEGAASVQGNVTGSVGSVTGNVGGNVAGDVQGNVDGSVASVAGNVTGNVTGSVGSVVGNVGGDVQGNVDGNVAGSVGSVAAGGVTAASFAANAIDANALATDAAQEIADTTLGRDFAAVVGAAARSLLNAARFLRNRRRSAGGTLTIYQEDDATQAWQGAVTTAASDPVIEIDPT